MQKYKLKTLLKKPSDNELMDLWTKLVKLRAGNKCEYPACMKTEYLNAHHLFSRSHFSTRYDPDNGLALCAGCHSLNNHSAHKNPFFIRDLIDGGIRTKEFLDKLERRAKSPAKIDRNLIKLDLENEIKKELLKPYKTTA